MLNEVIETWENLKDRILTHRRHCSDWADGEDCFNCHRGTIGEIENELNVKFKELILIK